MHKLKWVPTHIYFLNPSNTAGLSGKVHSPVFPKGKTDLFLQNHISSIALIMCSYLDIRSLQLKMTKIMEILNPFESHCTTHLSLQHKTPQSNPFHSIIHYFNNS